MPQTSLRAASLYTALGLAGCTLPERETHDNPPSIAASAIVHTFRSALSPMGISEAEQYPSTQELRKLIDKTSISLKAQVVSNLLPHCTNFQAEDLATLILSRSKTLAELAEVVTLVGKEALLSSPSSKLKNLVAHAALSERIEKLPLPDISHLPTTSEGVSAQIEAIEASCIQAIKISLEDRQLKQTAVVQDNLTSALYNLAYLASEREFLKNDSKAKVELIRMMVIKIGLERRYGILFSHSIDKSEEPFWREKGFIANGLPKIAEPSLISDENTGSKYVSNARRWRSSDLLEVKVLLDACDSTVFPRTTLLFSRAVNNFTRIGGEQYRRGLAFNNGSAEIYDGATDRLEPYLRSPIPVETHVGRTVLHELVHLLTYTDPEFERFITALSGWQTFRTLAVPSLREGTQWIALPGHGKVPLNTPTVVDETSRVYVLNPMQRIVYSYDAEAELPPEFESDSGPAHISTHLVVQGVEHPDVLSRSPLWREIIPVFWGEPQRRTVK